MLYAWIYFNDRFQDIFLPSATQWSERVALYRLDTGWDRDFFISLRSLDGQCFISPPDGFHWVSPLSSSREVSFTSGSSYTMEYGEYKLGVLCTSCQQEDTAFLKYTLPTGKVRLGRGQDCEMRTAPGIKRVSHLQGEYLLSKDGKCVYSDQSKNGSYLNGKLLTGERAELGMGDIITLNAGIKLVFLGNGLAINRISAFENISLEPMTTSVRQNTQMHRRTLQVHVDFHRTARFVEKPQTGEIHIDPPPEMQPPRQDPLWLTLGPSFTMVLPMLMGSVFSSSRSFMGAGLAMVGTASALAVGWGVANRRYRKKQAEDFEALRVEKYQIYIRQTEDYLRRLSRREHDRLMETKPSVSECARFPQENSYRLWERMPQHEDFLHVRLGLGDVPLPGTIVTERIRLSLTDDPLIAHPHRLAETYRTISQAPVTVDLRKETIFGILGGETAMQMAQSLVIELAALHSYHDLKIAVLTGASEYSQWSWARWLPHVFASEDRQLRLVVAEDDAIAEVLSHLDEVLSIREESSKSRDEMDCVLPHYVIVCTRPDILENKPLMKRMLRKRMGMTLILPVSSMDLLPNETGMVLDASSADQGVLYTSEGDAHQLSLELAGPVMARNFAHLTAPLRVRGTGENAAIPIMVPFLDVFGVRRAEELDVWRFWNENHVFEGLRAVIGMKAGAKPFVLDISDNAHGPHGLMAGTTGSGKSVMLQTYILSLALNYHPDQVRFILIDYKGGGMADAFRHLPHVTGIIDNLQSGNAIMRALASIQGEIHRREELLRKAGISGIDDYIRFTWHTPDQERLPHLIIIVDEFAELREEQPEFMRELISASRVGRSLGIHLILSTQKPSSSVSDEIWANTNFRVCLRVQSRGDSMEMLHRPEAAYLKNKGRCYIQIGNDEIFEQVQTSYSGLRYCPEEPTEIERPHLLDGAGRHVHVQEQRPLSPERALTQMEAVLHQIQDTARAHRLDEAVRLWMEELAPSVFLQDIPGGGEFDLKPGWAESPADGNLKAVYALGDDVTRQKHVPVWLEMATGRNFAAVGGASTGKTTLIQTLVCSFAQRYSPENLHIYILSLSSRTLGCLAGLPHVGEILYAEEKDELRRLLRLLEQEDLRRRQLFAEASTDSFWEYNRSQALSHRSTVPAVIVFADRLSQAVEALDNDEAVIDSLYSLVREGSGRGIFFICTALKYGEIPRPIRDCFRGVGLSLKDRSDYLDVTGMRIPSDMPDIAPYPGRGIAVWEDRLYEIQVALCASGDSDMERAEAVSRMCELCDKSWQRPRPKRIPRIPEKPRYTDFIRTLAWSASVGNPGVFPFFYDIQSGEPWAMRTQDSHTLLITGDRSAGKSNLLKLIAALWRSRDAEIAVAADAAWETFCQKLSIQRYDDYTGPEWEAYVSQLNTEIKNRSRLRKETQLSGGDAEAVLSRQTPLVILLDDLDAFVLRSPQVVLGLLNEIATRGAGFQIYVYAAVSHQGYARIRNTDPVPSFVRQRYGIALGGRLSECDPWNTSAVPFRQKSTSLSKGEAYLVDGGKLRRIVIPEISTQEV